MKWFFICTSNVVFFGWKTVQEKASPSSSHGQSDIRTYTESIAPSNGNVYTLQHVFREPEACILRLHVHVHVHVHALLHVVTGLHKSLL